MLVELKPVLVKRVLIFLASDIANGYGMDFEGALVRLRAVDVCWVWRRAVGVGLVVVKYRVHILRLRRGSAGGWCVEDLVRE